MKFLIVLAAVVAVAFAAAIDDVQVLKYENDNIGLGNYNFQLQTSDGTGRQETAELKNVGTDNEAISVRGSYQWTAPDGQVFTVNYIADENGFQPEGAHLPKSA